MKVVHKIENLNLSKTVDDCSFFLTSNGGYFFNKPNTKFRGLYFLEDKEWILFKTLDEIKFARESNEIVNLGTSVIQYYGEEWVKYTYNNNLKVELDYTGDIILSFDMRTIYDFDDKGRVYSVKKHDDMIIVKYTKFSENVLETINYVRYVAIKTSLETQTIDSWRLQTYSEDEARKSRPSQLYVYDALKLRSSGKAVVIISFGHSEEDAIRGLNDADVAQPEFFQIGQDDEKKLAYNLAAQSFLELYVHNQGFYAGLPWFFQIWSRDEALSLPALLHLGKVAVFKDVVLKRLIHLTRDGRLPNRYPPSEICTADGTGWLFRACGLGLDSFSQDELRLIKNSLEDSINAHKLHHVKGLLVENKSDETWMDTTFGQDTRSGFRIEIQALWLRMLRLFNVILAKLNQENKDMLLLEQSTKDEVKKQFFTGQFLKDGNQDDTIRPNLFLAYQAYPWLLKSEEWESVIDYSIPKLWLDWGGLATIDKSSHLYLDRYTGEDNRSYHRGDSWFYLNNLAAITMVQLNYDKYKKYVTEIISASTKDILFKGAIGRASELSSAKFQTAEGALYQLWSCATYLELISAITKS